MLNLFKRWLGVVTMLLSVLMVINACQAATPPEVTITAKEYAFEVPESIGGGVVTLKLANTGAEPHMAMLIRLNAGVTLDQFQAALKKQNPGAVLALVTLAGGINTTPPGITRTATLDLKAGDYAVLDFGGGPDKVPYLAKGMLKPFKVTAGSSSVEPSSDVAVTMKEYTFEMPTAITAGTHTFKFTNAGQQTHELTMLKLAEGQTLADVQAYLSNPKPGGPPPGELIEGTLPIGAGMRAWTTIDLKPGNYVAVCMVPDSADGKPHAMHGMMVPVTVK